MVRLVGLLLLALAAGCGGGGSEEIATADKVPVTTQAAARGTVRPAVLLTGIVKPAPGAELVVTAPQAARIAEIPKAEGDRVKKGDLLVRFDIPSLEADTAGRSSDLARARSRLDNARAARTRVEGLFARGIAAQKEVEDAAREQADAETGVAEAQSALHANSLLAARAVVRAPFAGVVAARVHNPGDLVDTSTPDPILRLIDPARLEVEAAVPLDALPLVAVGSRARVEAPAPLAPEEAVVRTRPAALDPATGAAVVRLAFSHPTRLPAGTPVRVEIEGPEHKDAVLVPAAALVEEGTEHFVFVVDGQGTAHRRPVRTGVSSGTEIEILSGITAGERVVTEGQSALPDGATVVQATAAAPSGDALDAKQPDGKQP